MAAKTMLISSRASGLLLIECETVIPIEVSRPKFVSTCQLDKTLC